MTRTIKINGKTIELESGHSVPPAAFTRGRPKSDFRLAVEAMKPGESFYLPLDGTQAQRKSGILNDAGKATGHKYCYRAENGGTRFFCMDTAPAKNRVLEAVGW